MAKPRVFVSSTFYDLRTVRSDIHALLQGLGYDPVLNERGAIPYERTKTLEESCYREIGSCDIVVSIIGGRLGSHSALDPELSISQLELKTAVELEKQLFVFVDKAVSVEYQTWLRNRDKGIALSYVDDPKIYEFLRFVYDLPRNNPVQSFEVANEISQFLRDQFAGLFQRYLSSVGSETVQVVAELRSLVGTMSTIVSKQAPMGPADEGIAALVYANQPLFVGLRRKLRNRYRVFFTDLKELNDWLRYAKNMRPVASEEWDDVNVMEWWRNAGSNGEALYLLKVANRFFDEAGALKYVSADNYNENDVQYYLADVNGRPIAKGTSSGGLPDGVE